MCLCMCTNMKHYILHIMFIICIYYFLKCNKHFLFASLIRAVGPLPNPLNLWFGPFSLTTVEPNRGLRESVQNSLHINSNSALYVSPHYLLPLSPISVSTRRISSCLSLSTGVWSLRIHMLILAQSLHESYAQQLLSKLAPARLFGCWLLRDFFVLIWPSNTFQH